MHQIHKLTMLLVSSCNCSCTIYWSQMLSREWRCSWDSADRRCCNYIWMINNFISYQDAAYIRGLTIICIGVPRGIPYYRWCHIRAMALQITDHSTVWSFCSDQHQRKRQSCALLSLCEESTADPWIHVAKCQWNGNVLIPRRRH